MPTYDTIIFDLDGTLLDTLDDLMDAANYALEQLGWPLRTKDEIRSFVGNGVARLMERAVPAGTDSGDAAKALELFTAYYDIHKQDKTAPYEGITEMLVALKEKGLTLAVVSNKFDSAVKALMPQYFPGLIDMAAGEAEAAGIPKKPHPAMVHSVMAALGADAATSVYVGDSDVDLQTARNAGLPCISVTWGFRDEDFLRTHGGTTFAHTPDQLVQLIG
ncbi:MAG: HAD-IA family hydrolase [Oscillospiraceae bacterium]|nr:HAD-IA family hydrolase [Oscillospiraceae bacterium]